MSPPDWRTVDGMIETAEYFDIGLTPMDAEHFIRKHNKMLTAGYHLCAGPHGSVSAGTFMLRIKFMLLDAELSGPAPPRPTAKPGRLFYCLDDYDRVTTVSPTSLLTSYDDEMSALQEVVYRKWEDARAE